MSWWVMEQVSVNEAGTQTLANIQCDDVSDLPAPNQSATLGYVIVRGSQAKVLATSENYILGSTGTWVKMEDGVKLDLTGYATEQYVDDGLADKVDTSVYSSGQAAQDAVIADKWGYIRGTIGGTGDFNTVVTSGYYRYNGAPANAPSGANGEFGILCVFVAGTYISQIAHCFLSSQYGLYIRSSTNTGSTWTAWVQL